MNRNQLRYFVSAAEHRSFTKAAEQYYISQTAVTQQIQQLALLLARRFRRDQRIAHARPHAGKRDGRIRNRGREPGEDSGRSGRAQAGGGHQ